MTELFSHFSIWADGIPNSRDLGGFRMRDGSVVRKGLLLRGASLAAASDADLEMLSRKYHVSYVFDFRNDKEIQHAPDREVEGAAHIWLPTLDPESGKQDEGLFAKMNRMSITDFIRLHADNPVLKKTGREMYTSMVVNEYTQLQYAVFLQKIADCDNGAVYWHCTHGKDRTGLGSAFVLAALGADRDTILADYNISSEVYREDVDRMSDIIRAEGFGEEELEVVKSFVGVNVRCFAAALDLIDSRYGSLDSYIRNELALSEEDIARMRRRYLCDPSSSTPRQDSFPCA